MKRGRIIAMAQTPIQTLDAMFDEPGDYPITYARVERISMQAELQLLTYGIYRGVIVSTSQPRAGAAFSFDRAVRVGQFQETRGEEWIYDPVRLLLIAQQFASEEEPAFAWPGPQRADQAGRPALDRWRTVVWTDGHRQPVQSFVCHLSELREVLSLPWPAGAVEREPVEIWTGGRVPPYYRTTLVDWTLLPGETTSIEVNQGVREATVLAARGRERLIEYQMPRGSSSLRLIDLFDRPDRTISYAKLPVRWLQAIVDAGMDWIGAPQQGGKRELPSPPRLLEQKMANRHQVRGHSPQANR